MTSAWSILVWRANPEEVNIRADGQLRTDDIWWILDGQDYPRLWWELIAEN